VLRSDWVIVATNGVGATLAAILLACKVRDLE
jgi:hypothetical protein